MFKSFIYFYIICFMSAFVFAQDSKILDIHNVPNVNIDNTNENQSKASNLTASEINDAIPKGIAGLFMGIDGMGMISSFEDDMIVIKGHPYIISNNLTCFVYDKNGLKNASCSTFHEGNEVTFVLNEEGEVEELRKFREFKHKGRINFIGPDGGQQSDEIVIDDMLYLLKSNTKYMTKSGQPASRSIFTPNTLVGIIYDADRNILSIWKIK